MPAQAGIIEFTFYISASRESDILIIARSGIFLGEVMKTNESNKKRSAAWISGVLKRQSIPKEDFVSKSVAEKDEMLPVAISSTFSRYGIKQRKKYSQN